MPASCAQNQQNLLLPPLRIKMALNGNWEEEITLGQPSFVHNGNIKSNGIFIIYSGKHPDDLSGHSDDICGYWADLTRTIGFAYAAHVRCQRHSRREYHRRHHCDGTGRRHLSLIFGFIAVVLALSTLGGFVVTDRMLEMFKKKIMEQIF